MDFEFEEDKLFFQKLLCKQGEAIDKYKRLFDFREVKLKRQEFNKIRSGVLKKYLAGKGQICELSFKDICDTKSGFNIDHLIPLSSNKLNKELRKLEADKGRKVATQSFGSNHEDNLLLTCKKCNSFKKHKFLGARLIEKILIRLQSGQ
jgi:hypothetical protein